MKTLFISDFTLQQRSGGAQVSNDIIIKKGRELGYDITEHHHSSSITDFLQSYDLVINSNLEAISKISPEKLNYVSSDGKLTYSTDGFNAYGPIKSVNVESQGKGYKSLPGIATIFSDFGNEAILKPKSNNIGRISNVDIKNIGFDYSADKTLKPQAQLPQLVEVDSLASILRIGITSVGTNYLNSPGLIVLDGLTKKVVPDIDLDYEIGDTRVSILNNTKNLNIVTHILIPTSNSNGITINNVDFNAGTKDVTITIGASFSDAADYPFEVGKKVMIEGVSVGVGSTGTGYNSENYEYTLFEIKATDPNIGGTLGTVRYSLSDVIPTGSVPGTFVAAASAGKIIPESYFPIFDIKLEDNKFEIGETLISGNKKGTLQSTNKLSGVLKVSSPHTFIKGESITGESSGTKATIIDAEL